MKNDLPKTNRLRRRFERIQRIHAPPDAVFPLLCPVREYDWIPEWDCRLLYTESGLAEAGCVFQTNREAEGGLDTWVISRYEPNRHIAFVRINHLRAMQYDVRLEAIDQNSSKLLWAQVITALSDKGDRHVASLQEADFARGIANLETLLNDYLARQANAQAGS
ncbi:hypothetical protein G4Y73_11230 [Wenzhouxiangella sp. XN201]|uniref:hypothetical protein n=1 Tax=Wenzhouxiangella sp. XN201 TaxID=2710755 RepID=UPI0013CA3CD3|nr:hypothetical protein [Wenzhouxiangella sp. XN201]NEZ04725.1 hypothetical protein [Wenzhouxiangella sp. XN201]